MVMHRSTFQWQRGNLQNRSHTRFSPQDTAKTCLVHHSTVCTVLVDDDDDAGVWHRCVLCSVVVHTGRQYGVVGVTSLDRDALTDSGGGGSSLQSKWRGGDHEQRHSRARHGSIQSVKPVRSSEIQFHSLHPIPSLSKSSKSLLPATDYCVSALASSWLVTIIIILSPPHLPLRSRLFFFNFIFLPLPHILQSSTINHQLFIEEHSPPIRRASNSPICIVIARSALPHNR